jgi:hypothetical protein
VGWKGRKDVRHLQRSASGNSHIYAGRGGGEALFFRGVVFSLLGGGGWGAHGDLSIDVECLAGDLSAGLTDASKTGWGRKNGCEAAGWERRGSGDVLPRRSGGSATKKRHP